MEDPSPVSTSSGSNLSSASEQARIRRERREAKIKAGGASRLNKITGAGGGLQRDASTTTPKVAAVSHADPEEVDISEHCYQPAQNVRPRTTPDPNRTYPGLQDDPTQIDDEALRAMMLGLSPREGNPQFGQHGANGADDPMMAMLQQMMGGAGATPSFSSLPPMDLPGQQANPDPYSYIWRIVHAVFAVGLGLYIAMMSEFTGTKLAREESALSNGVDWKGKYLFIMGEAFLQGSRFVFGKGTRPPQTGILGVVLPFLPPAWRSSIEWATTYLVIFTTISGDLFSLVFILGLWSWLK